MWILLLPFFVLAWQCSRLADLHSPWHRLGLSLALGSAAMVLFTLLSAPWTRSLGTSLALAAGLAALLALALFLNRRGTARLSWKLSFSAWHALLLLWLLATSYMVAKLALGLDFHDQMRTQGHPAVIEGILRGNFPPQLQAFPEIPLKYHFGGDLLAAILAYAFGLSGLRAIDCLQIGGWIAAGLCLYSLGRSLGMSRFLSLLGLHWILLAAGWLYLLKPWTDLPPLPLDGYWPDNYVIFGRYLNPGVLSYFFQTPYSLGLPLFFAWLTLFSAWLRRKSPELLFVLLVLLGALSIVQVTLFLGTLGCAIAAILGQCIFRQADWRRNLLESAALLLGALLIALFLGGFFGGSGAYSSKLLIFQWPPGYLNHAASGAIGLRQAMVWYFSTLGSLVLWAAPISILFVKDLFRKRCRAMQLFFFCFAIGSICLTQFFRYRLSWDIIKWFTAFQVSLILLILLTASLSRKGRLLFLGAILLASLLDTLPSYRMLIGLSFGRPEQYEGKQKKWFFVRAAVNQPWVPYLAERLREHKRTEMVLASPTVSDVLSIATGQAMASLDYNTIAFGVRPEILQSRRADIQGLLKHFDIDRMRQGPVRWLVFRCEEYAKSFSPASQGAIEEAAASGSLREIHVPENLGCWKIFRIPD